MAKTTNYEWNLPNPVGIQITEMQKVADTLSAIDGTFAAFEQAYSTHTHSFASLAERPTTLGGYGITDGMTADEVASAIRAAVDGLINGSGAALDTLKELADALGNDPEFATTVGNALGVRVRVDAAQGFNLSQKAQGRANIDAVGTVDKGKADGVASLDSTGKVPSGQLPALTTTATVGAATAAANAKTTPADGDFFAGVLAGGSTMFKTTWANIKAALTTFFDGRYLTLTGGTLTNSLNVEGNLTVKARTAQNGAELWFRDETGANKALIFWNRGQNYLEFRRYDGTDWVTSFQLTGDGQIRFLEPVYSSSTISTGTNQIVGSLTHPVNGGYLNVGSYSTTTYGNGSGNLWWNHNTRTLNLQAAGGGTASFSTGILKASAELNAGDARYLGDGNIEGSVWGGYAKTWINNALGGKANTSHTHTASQISNFNASVDARIAAVMGNNSGTAPVGGYIMAQARNSGGSVGVTMGGGELWYASAQGSSMQGGMNVGYGTWISSGAYAGSQNGSTPSATTIWKRIG